MDIKNPQRLQHVDKKLIEICGTHDRERAVGDIIIQCWMQIPPRPLQANSIF